ncbi:hypothetical protein [Serinicoccus sediminis]|uniref:hypothetical protein n=1 Tax=Serinicoccus sediminis TaxID=2306021 RepID=UPI00101FBF1C|nr:hypothetical protein [Serinicoccus sediminis]
MSRARSTFVTLETRAARAWRWVERDSFRETIALVLAAGSVVLGVVMITDPGPFERPTFAVAMQWMPAQTWGTFFVLTAAAMGLTVLTSRRDAYWPAVFLTGLYCGWSAAALGSTTDPTVVLSAVVVYSLVSVLCMITALSYWRESRPSP